MSCYRDLNPGPLPYQGSALPLSYNSKEEKRRAEDGTQTRDPQLGRLMLYQLSYFRNFLWAKMDSNHRRRKPADLQSAPFGHSGICPTSFKEHQYNPVFFFFRASCRIRTNDPEITNHVLWPTELKRQINFATTQSPRLSGCKVRYYFLITKYFP